MKRLLVVAVIALAFVSGASAKAPPNGFRVCGAAACAAISQNDAELLAINLFYTSTGTLSAAPEAAPFYALHWQWPKQAEQTAYYVPTAKAVYLHSDPGRVSAGWDVLNDTATAALTNATNGLQSFPTPAIVRVTVWGKPVHDPASYAQLWSIGKRVWDYPTGDLLRVRIFTEPMSAWHGSLYLAKRGNLMLRDDTVYAIPARLAARVRARLSLR